MLPDHAVRSGNTKRNEVEADTKDLVGSYWLGLSSSSQG
ncbi:hypothetical protein Pse7367_1833 [Thalassoporum mexicanum PCC 7367]|nr:hypothetical protein Pse7367_1833 [Pseudanabaena sp. PCC 7367]